MNEADTKANPEKAKQTKPPRGKPFEKKVFTEKEMERLREYATTKRLSVKGIGTQMGISDYRVGVGLLTLLRAGGTAPRGGGNGRATVIETPQAEETASKKEDRGMAGEMNLKEQMELVDARITKAVSPIERQMERIGDKVEAAVKEATAQPAVQPQPAKEQDNGLVTRMNELLDSNKQQAEMLKAINDRTLTEDDVKNLMAECSQDPDHPFCQVIQQKVDALKEDMETLPLDLPESEHFHTSPEEFFACPTCRPQLMDHLVATDDLRAEVVKQCKPGDIECEVALARVREEGYHVKGPNDSKFL